MRALANYFDQLGIPKWPDLQVAFAKDHKGLIIADRALRQFHHLAQAVRDPEFYDDGIKYLFALNQFKLGLKENGIERFIGGLKNLQIAILLFHPQHGRGFVNLWLQFRDHKSRRHHQN